jgi:Fic family protein
VGVFQGSQVAHVAPPKSKVPDLMENLFTFIRKNKEIPLLIKAAIFYYEVEFIHPFSDGNGRMGRLWQQLILMSYNPIFSVLAVETLIKNYQQEYYAILGQCDRKGESTQFIEFSLKLVLDALRDYLDKIVSVPNTSSSRMIHAKKHFTNQWFTRKQYMQLHKDISSATASRDLKKAFLENELEVDGEKSQARYRFSG